MVISFHKAHDRLPTNWEELKPYYNGEDAPHHGKSDFDDLRKAIVIDLDQLNEIKHRATLGNDTETVNTREESRCKRLENARLHLRHFLWGRKPL